MIPTTPNGTLMRPTWMPVGREWTPVISPTGSGRAAISASPWAIASIRASVSSRRSARAASSARPASRSRRLAARSAGRPARIACAVASRRAVARRGGRSGKHARRRTRALSQPSHVTPEVRRFGDALDGGRHAWATPLAPVPSCPSAARGGSAPSGPVQIGLLRRRLDRFGPARFVLPPRVRVPPIIRRGPVRGSPCRGRAPGAATRPIRRPRSRPWTWRPDRKEPRGASPTPPPAFA